MEYVIENLCKKNLDDFKIIHKAVLPIRIPFLLFNSLLKSESSRKYSLLVYKEGKKKSKLSEIEKPIKKMKKKKKCVGAIGCKLHEKSNRIEILMFSVLSSYRRKGIGSLILREIEKNIKINDIHIETIQLHVHTANKSGIKFYEKHKFKKIKKIDNYYRRMKPSSAFLMSKNIDFLRINKEKEK